MGYYDVGRSFMRGIDRGNQLMVTIMYVEGHL